MKKMIVLALACVCCFAQCSKGEKEIPTPVFDARPEYVQLYRTAWEQARAHIKYQPGLVQPLYMDEGFRDEAIWIWDSEFMVMFCKYAPDIFPGIQTLDNFYYTLHEKAGSPLSVWHPDNPPFFAWVENDYFKFTDDKAHIEELIKQKRFLQKHFELFNTMNHDTEFPFPISNDGVRIQYKGIGYNWQSWQSGMDNTPRKRAMPMFWIDAISQQALSALYISRLAAIAGDKATEDEYKAIYQEYKEKINKYYWDDEDGCYYDIREDDLSKTHILTPASFWPMLAEVPSQEQAEAMVAFALKDDKLGGAVPWTSVSRDDPDFDSDGNYWKGSMWLPTAYMAIKALEKYGFFEEADSTAEAILEHMWQTYDQYDPHTIWECYNPTKPEPASKKEGTKNVKSVKADFCGWSALGPISLFIENVLGFYDVDAAAATVRWNLHQACRHGIEKLSFGSITTDIIYDNGKVKVRSNKPYTLYINGKEYPVRRGLTEITPTSPK
ncbi:MAG: alpha,alpha-trehalase [Bacteroidales bacterium]|nr:alpha,alpha-trehalase [Bacteroidales bacterium]